MIFVRVFYPRLLPRRDSFCTCNTIILYHVKVEVKQVDKG